MPNPGVQGNLPSGSASKARFASTLVFAALLAVGAGTGCAARFSRPIALLSQTPLAIQVGGLSIDFGPLAGGQTITVSGSGFVTGATASIGGTPCASTVVLSSTQLQCVTSAMGAGTYGITVQNPSGTSTTVPGSYTFQANPTVGGVVPPSGNASGGATLTVTGTLFRPGIAISINGTPCTSSTWVNSTTATCVAPALPVGGPYALVVTNLDGQAGSAAVSYTALSTAVLTISDAVTYTFPTTTVGLSSVKVFTVTQSGGLSATLGTVSTAALGLAAPYALTGGTCSTGAVLGTSASCTIQLTYTPIGAGASSDSLDLAYDDGASPQTASRPLAGSALNPASLSISDPGFDYGTVVVGNAPTQTFTVSNAAGVASATLGTVSAAGLGLAAPYALAGGTCSTGLVLAASASCTLILSFTPLAGGVANDSIDLSHNNGVSGTSVSRAITGTGLAAGALSISDPGYSYGTVIVGASPSKTFTVSNAAGGASATLGTVSTAGLGLAAPYSLTGGTCSTGLVLAASATCTLIVSFAPLAGGVANDSIDLAYNNGAVGTSVSRAITGTGQMPAVLSISNPGFNYGNVATSSSLGQTFTVSNAAGGASATLGTVSTAGLGLAAPYTLTGGTCSTGLVLAASGSCTLAVTFSPTVGGVANDSIDLGYNDGVAAQTASRAITGTGLTTALLSISNPGFDYGPVVIGNAPTQTFTVSNAAGVVSATLGTVSTAGLGLAAPYTLSGGTCSTGLVLAASASCTLIVAFTPTIGGAANDSIDLAYDDGVGPQTASRAITGTGQGPASLSISDPGYTYGTVLVGAAPTQTFTVTNAAGGASATLGTVSTAALNLAAPYTLTGGTCSTGLVLAASGTCTLIVTFTPLAGGVANDSIDVTYNNGVISTATASRAITGTGQMAAVLSISNPGFNYGNVATSSSLGQTFTVSNAAGGASATLGTVSTAGLGLAAPYTLTGGTCSTGLVLAASGTCTLTVTFAPTVGGVANDSIDLGYNDGIGPQTASRAITGMGLTAAVLSISNPGFDYGSVVIGNAPTQTFTVSNAAGVVSATLGTVSTVGLGLAAPYTLSGGTCSTGLALAASASCTLIVAFTPTVGGVANDSIDLGYNDGMAAQTASRAITGTGQTAASLSISDPAYNYGTVVVGSTPTKTFTVSNAAGGASATLGTVSTAGLSLAAPYTLTGGTCSTGLVLAASATCTLIVTFTPTVGGFASDSIDLGYNNGASATSVSRAITGTGQAAASLSISNPGFDYGSVLTGSSANQTFTVSNAAGGASATLGTVSTAGLSLAAPYTLTGGTCTTGQVLAPSGTCTLIVTFSPTVTGAANDTIVLSYNNGAFGTSVSRAITGTGTTVANLVFLSGGGWATGSPVVYGPTGNSQSQTFGIQNIGGATSSVITASLIGATPGMWTVASDTCTGATLAFGAVCTVQLVFAAGTPGNVAGFYTTALEVSAASGGTINRSIEGTSAYTWNFSYRMGQAAAGGGVLPSGSCTTRSATQTYNETTSPSGVQFLFEVSFPNAACGSGHHVQTHPTAPMMRACSGAPTWAMGTGITVPACFASGEPALPFYGSMGLPFPGGAFSACNPTYTNIVANYTCY